MKVKLLDLAAEYAEIKNDALREIKKVCDRQGFVLGENVRKLEEELANLSKAKYAVGVASGSDALMLALMALGIRPGDKVITTPYTFFSTAGSISILGAIPVFVDIDPKTFNIDPLALRKILKDKKGKGAKAVIPVHLYGQCADMTAINKIAKEFKLSVVEDAAQSIGATYKGRGAGSMGDVGCFSFYPTKNLGCFGDAGLVTANNKTLAEKLRILRVHGSAKRYEHTLVGVNSRIDEIQAAVLRVKLKKLKKWETARIKNAKLYGRLFSKADLEKKVRPPFIEEHNHSVFNQYVIRAKSRDKLREHLAKNGIGSEIYYPLPLHLQRCFKDLGYKRGDFPEAERAAKETLALPIFPFLKVKEIEYVVQVIKDFYEVS